MAPSVLLSETQKALETLILNKSVKRVETDYVTAYRMPNGYRIDVKEINPT